MLRADTARIVLLRGINLGATNRIAMPTLRDALTQAGYEDVRTYVQSGNIVLRSSKPPAAVAARTRELIKETFDLDIPVVVRTGAELAAVVKLNPLGEVADEPKRYQVSFCDTEPDARLLASLDDLVTGDERVTAAGREIYAWHPAGVARSKLANKAAGKGLGVTATARNWKTVTTLLAMAKGEA
jgi:uncharacterized protein (DUF1697 family)